MMEDTDIKFDYGWVDECVESIYEEIVGALVASLPKAKELGENGVAYTNRFTDKERKLSVTFGISIEEISDEQATAQTTDTE